MLPIVLSMWYLFVTGRCWPKSPERSEPGRTALKNEKKIDQTRKSKIGFKKYIGVDIVKKLVIKY